MACAQGLAAMATSADEVHRADRKGRFGHHRDGSGADVRQPRACVHDLQHAAQLHHVILRRRLLVAIVRHFLLKPRRVDDLAGSAASACKQLRCGCGGRTHWHPAEEDHKTWCALPVGTLVRRTSSSPGAGPVSTGFGMLLSGGSSESINEICAHREAPLSGSCTVGGV